MATETYIKMFNGFSLLLNNKKLDNMYLRLAGGEPLLMFNVWKMPVAQFFEKHRGKIEIDLVTNLSLPLTDEILNYLRKYDVRISASLDGFDYSKPTHDGESSHVIVKKNIDILIENKIKHITISSVITNKSFDSITLLAEFIAKRNLSWAVSLDHFLREINEAEIVDKMYAVIDILCKYNYDLYNKFRFNNIMVNRRYEGCTAGEKLIAIDTDGNVYPCHTVMNRTPICQIDENLLDNLKSQKCYKIGYNYTLPEPCKDCGLSAYCGGGCKINNTEINKNNSCVILRKVILYIAKNSLDQKQELEYDISR
jgi:uncharacterized protein